MTNHSRQWRLLVSPPASGAENMALDEALMERARETGEWTARVYSWATPTVSLGRNQTARGRYDLDRINALGYKVVRRPTGGRAILHDREITYSVTALVADAGDLLDSYAQINQLGDVHHRSEVEFSIYNFEEADVAMLFQLFDMYEKESIRMNEKGLVLPSYDYCLKCSHTFNLLEARGAISVTERTQYIARVRNLARFSAEAYLKQRESMGFPLLKKNAGVKSQNPE